MTVYTNSPGFLQDKYGNERVKKQSSLTRFRIDQEKPNYIPTQIQRNLISDETQFIQFGLQDEEKFQNIVTEDPRPSQWADLPTMDQPNSKYKITSLDIFLSMDQEVIERQTYSLLEWLGDCGGLFDALRIIGVLIIWPLNNFKLKS